MRSKGNIEAEEQEVGRESDMRRLMSTLDRLFSTLREQLQSQAPRPFTGNAKIAVDKFNEIAARLKFESRPRAVTAAPPQELSATEVELTWTDTPGNADGYRVERCEGHHCHDFVEIARLTSTERSFKDFNLFTGTPYRYRVVAFNFRGEMPSNIVGITPTISRDK